MRVCERLHEVSAHRAAQAAGVEQHPVLGRRRNQQVVDPDLAEFVDDDCGIRERRLLPQVIEQRRLAAAQKTSDTRY